MNFLLILPYYLLWHYGTALKDIKNIWVGFILYVYNFFSIPILLSSLFSSWERVHDPYGSDLALNFQNFIFNSIMRVVGVVLRLIFIIMGLIGILILLLLGVIFYAFWFFLPLIILNLVGWGVTRLSFT